MTLILANLLKPFVMLALSVCVLYPVRRAVQRHMKDGRLKRVLLFRVSDADSYRRKPRQRSLADPR
jgi:hypothetical protein